MKKFALSLRGGGAKVAAYLGVIKALKEAGLKPDMYIASSAGSIIAVAMAAELKPELVASHLTRFLPSQFVDLDSLIHFSLASSDRSIAYAEELVGNLRLEDLPTPTYLQITNLSKGNLEYVSKGHAAEFAVTAALLPLVYKPRQIGEYTYSDGDILSGYGVDFAKSKGIDCVIALEPEDMLYYEYNPDLGRTYLNMIFLLLRAHLESDKQKNPPELILHTPVIGPNMMDFTKSNDLLQLGYEFGTKNLAKISKILET